MIKVKYIKQLNISTRDMTIGKTYEAVKLTFNSHEADGCLVDTDDGIKLIDDVGDIVYSKMSSGFELVGDIHE